MPECLRGQSVADIMLASQIQLCPQHCEGPCQDTGIIYGSCASCILGLLKLQALQKCVVRLWLTPYATNSVLISTRGAQALVCWRPNAVWSPQSLLYFIIYNVVRFYPTNIKRTLSEIISLGFSVCPGAYMWLIR